MPANPRRHYGSTLASTAIKRKLIRFRQHSPNSGVEVHSLNRVFTRSARVIKHKAVVIHHDASPSEIPVGPAENTP